MHFSFDPIYVKSEIAAMVSFNSISKTRRGERYQQTVQ